MIDLNTPVEPTEVVEVDRGLLADGEYRVVIDEVREWTARLYPVFEATVYDDRMQVMKDANGKTLKETLKNVEVWSTVVVLKVSQGARKGKNIYVNLTTNPNRPWDLSKFVKGLGAGKVAPGDFDKYVGTEMDVIISTETYPYQDYVDNKTGETVYKDSKSRNIVKYYKPIETTF